MNAGELIIKTELDTKSFDAQISYIEKQLDEIETILSQPKDFELSDDDFIKLNQEAEKLRNRLKDLNDKKKELNNPPQETINWSEGFGASLEKSIKKVSRLVLGIFGIRGAYMAVRNAMNTILANDDQLSADITYMKNVIAYMLEPVVRKIVGWFKQLMYYVGYIAKAWFGVNIYANASAKAIDAGAKKAKEMKKQLAGFDEMNVLSDSSGGEENVAPSFDLGNMEDMPIPSWIQWIADNKEEVIAGLAGIAGGLIAVKLGASGLMGLGIGIAIYGIVLLIQDIIDFINDPSWENFSNILVDLSYILIGVAIALIAVNGANPLSWILLVISAVMLLGALVIQNWDKIKGVIGVVASWIYDHIIKPIADFFVNLWNKIIDGVKNAVKWIKDTFNSVVTFFKNIINNIVTLFKTIGSKVGDAISGAFKAVINGVLGAIEGILNFPIRSINKLIDVINKVPGINLGKLSTFNLPRLAKGGIINMPGKGVPVGSTIGGERGSEGVIPLTDSQQMALLGEAIGKYININATVPVYVGNRQIAREIRKIEAENDFAYNS